MMTAENIALTHNLSVADIGLYICLGEHFTLKRATTTITRCCPTCGKPIISYPHNTHWLDSRANEEITNAGQYIYTDGDTILSQEDDWHNISLEYPDLNSEMLSGRCFFCGESYALVEAFCFNHIPRPEESDRGDPCVCLMNTTYEGLAHSVEKNELYLVCLGDDPIGVMSYGKNISFRSSAFHYPKDDFVTDCCAFQLDCLYTGSQLGDSPKGVCCGHFDLKGTRDDWYAAAVIAEELYRVGKEHICLLKEEILYEQDPAPRKAEEWTY